MRPMSAVMTFAVRYFFFFDLIPFLTNHVQYVCFGFVIQKCDQAVVFVCLFVCLLCLFVFVISYLYTSDPILFLTPTYTLFSLVSKPATCSQECHLSTLACNVIL